MTKEQKKQFKDNMLILKSSIEDKFKEIEDSNASLDDVRTVGITAAMAQQVTYVDAENLVCHMSFPIRDWQSNPYGTCHGGIIATALDNALGGVAKWANLGKIVTTLNLNINYLKAVHVNDNLIVKVKCVSWGKFAMCLSGEAYEESTCILTDSATAMYRILPEDSVL